MSKVNIAPGVAADEKDKDTERSPDEVANHDLYKAFQDRESTPDDPATVADDDAGDESGADDGVAPSDSAPVSDPDHGDDDDHADDDDTDDATDDPIPPDESFTLLDRKFNREEASQALQVVDWAQNLSPDHVQAIDAVLSGEYVVVPRAEYEASPRTVRPEEVTTPELGQPFDDDDDLDPAVKARFDRLSQSINSLSSQQQQVLAQQQKEAHQQVLAAVNTGATRFSTAHALSADESRVLQERVVSMQILPGYANTYNGDAAMAMEKAMEAVYWSDDTYRQREMDRRMEKESSDRRAEGAKQRKAGSVTGTGGSVARVEPMPTSADRRSAMVKEVADAMNGGQRSG